MKADDNVCSLSALLALALALAGLDLGLGGSGGGNLLLEQRNHLVELPAALVIVLLQLLLGILGGGQGRVAVVVDVAMIDTCSEENLDHLDVSSECSNVERGAAESWNYTNLSCV